VALDKNVRDQFGVVAKLHVRADHAAGTNLDIGADFDAVIDDGGGMNLSLH